MAEGQPECFPDSEYFYETSRLKIFEADEKLMPEEDFYNLALDNTVDSFHAAMAP